MWVVEKVTLDGNKDNNKVGSVSLSYANAYEAETFETSIRFPLIKGTNKQQLDALVIKANSEKSEFITQKTSEEALITPIQNALNA
jgi:hypothetical protein